jgi:hypothetical protein
VADSDDVAALMAMSSGDAEQAHEQLPDSISVDHLSGIRLVHVHAHAHLLATALPCRTLYL